MPGSSSRPLCLRGSTGIAVRPLFGGPFCRYSAAMKIALLLLLFMADSAASWGCSYRDPYADPSGYASWCSCMGGTLYRDSGNNPACDVRGSSPPPPPPDPADEAFRQGYALQQAGNLEGAERYYLQALGYNNRLAAAYNNLANIYRKWERYEKAVDYYVKAIQYAPSNPDREAYRKNLRSLYLNRAAFYLNRKEYGVAESWFRSVLGMVPGDSDALSGLDEIRERQANSEGNIRFDAKDYGGAIASYNEALRHCREKCDYIRKNIAYAQRNREADRAWKLFDQKDYDGAIAASERALGYCRADMDCDYLRKKIAYARRNRDGDRGNQLFDRKEYDAAIAAYEVALHSCRADMDCGYLHKNIDAAKQNRKNDQHRRENRSLEEEARELAGAGEGDRAEEALRALVKRNPKSAHYANRLGLHLLERGKLAEAEAAFRDGIRINPSDAVLHHNLAVALAQQDRHEEAREAAEASLTLDPSYQSPAQLLEALKSIKLAEQSDRLEASGEVDQAERLLRDQMAQNPGDTAVSNRLGNLLAEQFRHEEAEEVYRRALEHEPDSAVLHYNLSLLMKREGRYEEAEQQAQRAVQFDPTYQRAKELLNDLQQNNFIERHLDPIVFPVFNAIGRSVSALGSKRKKLAKSLQDDYRSVMEQASSAQFHGYMAEGSAGESAKEESGRVFDNRGQNIGNVIDPLTVDGRQPEQSEALPEGLLRRPEWQELDVLEKSLQQEVLQKEKEIGNLEQMRSSSKLSGVKKAMVLVAIAKKKEELFFAEREVKVAQDEKEKLKVSFSLGELTETLPKSSGGGE